MKKTLVLTVLLLMPGLTGCMTARVPDVSETLVAADYQPEQHQPQRINVPVGKTAPEAFRQSAPAERYTLSMVDIDIREALAALSRLSNVPIVAEPEVVGTVNLAVKDNTVAEILMTMIKPLGYTASVDEGLIVVGKPGLVTRAFYLNYLKDKRSFSSVTNASISSTSDKDAASGGQGNVRVTTVGGSDFWVELLKGLELMVFGGAKPGEGGTEKRIVINDMSGVVYVTDTEDNMKLVSSFLADVGKELKRQVLIQAHIVEVDLDKEFSLGIDWAGVFNSGDIRISQNLSPAALLSKVFSININSGDFNLMLDAFKEQGHVNMLSSPKISTMNNQKAVIKLTTKAVTWIQEETFRGDNSSTSTVTTTPQIDEVGLFLDVTPNIDVNGVVTMHVHPSISEIKEISVSPDGSSSKPIISVREIDTIAEVLSGQTVVIAGLIVDRTREVKRSVPLLGDIPYLGMAFSNFQQEHKKTELVIFLTPFVLDGSSVEQIRQQHEDRLQGMEELTQFIETRSKVGTNMGSPTSGSVGNGATAAGPEDVVVKGDARPATMAPDKGEIVAVESLLTAPSAQMAPSSDSIQWATPPPKRATGN